MKSLSLAAFLLILLFLFSTAQATTYNFQAKLTDKTGKAVTTPKTITFRIYNTATGGTPVWTEQKEVTPDLQGNLQAKLGETASLNLAPGNYYVEVQINEETMTPRHLTGFNLYPSVAIPQKMIAKPLLSQAELRELTRRQYERFLDENPSVRDAIIWRNTAVYRYDTNWTSEMKSELFNNYLYIYETGAPYPYSAPPAPGGCSDFSTLDFTDRWNLYLASIAFSLYLEKNRLTIWRITDLSREDLALLFDSDEILTNASRGFYHITAWNPKFCYDFLSSRGMIKSSPGATIYEFTNWYRKYIYHVIGRISGICEYYGYSGPPPIDQVLTPRRDAATGYWKNLIYGCYGTTALYKAVLRSVNIPVRAHMRFRDMEGGVHSGCEFPTANLAVIHGDDLLSRFGIYSIPTDQLFISMSELISTFPYPPATPDLSAQNHKRWEWAVNHRYPSDFYIRQRCQAVAPPYDYTESTRFFTPEQRRAFDLAFSSPLCAFITEVERADWTRRIDEIIERESGPILFYDRSYERERTINATPPR